jgi:hypothetical protein
MNRALVSLMALAALATMGATNFYPDDPNGQTASDYMAPRAFQPKAGVCIVFDDGFDGFLDEFIRLSDIIEDDTGVRIRGTTAIMPNSIEENSLTGGMTWADLRSFTHRQDDFEIAMHATATDEHFGSRRSGFSRAWMDSALGEWVDLCAAARIPAPRTFILPGHKYTAGMEQTWVKHQIYQVGGISVAPSADTTYTSVISNGRDPTECNSDPWPASSLNYTTGRWLGYQRHGGIQNRWNIGRRTSYDNNTDTLDSLRRHVEVAVQTRSMFVIGFHDVDEDTTAAHNLTCHPDVLEAWMRVIAAYVNAGVLESLTFEQMAARGVGTVYGELLPHAGFLRLEDVDTSQTFGALGENIPIGWSLDTGSEDYFYPIVTDTFVASDGDTGQTKVWDLGVDGDTVLAIFTAESSADSVSYGAGFPPDTLFDGRGAVAGGRILLVASHDGNYSRSIPVLVQTTGVQSGYIDISVQAMVNNATSPSSWVAPQFGQYRESWNDFTNYGRNSYDFYMSAGGAITPPRIDQFKTESTRLTPLFSSSYLDTTLTHPDLVGSGGFNTEAGMVWRYHQNLVPFYNINGLGTWDQNAPFGNRDSVNAKGAADQAHTANLTPFRGVTDLDGGFDYGKGIWVTYNYRVPIVPGQTDWVAGYIFLYRVTAWTGSPTLLISNISAVAGRG